MATLPDSHKGRTAEDVASKLPCASITQPGQIIAVLALEPEWEDDDFDPDDMVGYTGIGGLVILVPVETPGLFDNVIHATEKRHYPICAGCQWQIIRPLTLDEILEFTVHVEDYYYVYAAWQGWVENTRVIREAQL